MLEMYLIALVVGGGLLLLSLLTGGEGDADADLDTDLAADAELGLDGELAAEGELAADAGGFDLGAWLPIASLRFWTFFTAFFGATGVALTLNEPTLSVIATALIASGMGYVCGTGAVVAFRYMRSSQTSSEVSVGDYMGESAIVRVSVARGKVGKVRLEVKGRRVELLAKTDEPEPFAVREQAMIYAVDPQGFALLTRVERSRPPSAEATAAPAKLIRETDS